MTRFLTAQFEKFPLSETPASLKTLSKRKICGNCPAQVLKLVSGFVK